MFLFYSGYIKCQAQLINPKTGSVSKMVNDKNDKKTMILYLSVI